MGAFILTPMIFKLTLFICLLSPALYAQESVNASGGNASGSGGSASYTAGQVFYVTNGTVTTEAQGVQQPYEISVIDGVGEPGTFEFSIYPNPTTDQLILETNNTDLDQLSYKLFDGNGKLIESNGIQSDKTILNLSGLAKASYVITIFNEDKTSQSFKILKH